MNKFALLADSTILASAIQGWSICHICHNETNSHKNLEQ